MTLTPDPPYALSVDDDPEIRELVGDALYRHGLVPLLAASDAEAIGLMAGASAPVLVVLPFRLRGVSTADLLAKLRADARWARARVLLTSTVPRAYVPNSLRIDGFLEKPFDAESLRTILRAVMDTNA